MEELAKTVAFRPEQRIRLHYHVIEEERPLPLCALHLDLDRRTCEARGVDGNEEQRQLCPRDARSIPHPAR